MKLIEQMSSSYKKGHADGSSGRPANPPSDPSKKAEYQKGYADARGAQMRGREMKTLKRTAELAGAQGRTGATVTKDIGTGKWASLRKLGDAARKRRTDIMLRGFSKVKENIELLRAPLIILEGSSSSRQLGYRHARAGKPAAPPPGTNPSEYRSGYDSGKKAPREPRSKPTRAAPAPLNYDPDKHYVAVRLSPNSKKHLLSKHPPIHDNTNAEHVTLVPPGAELSDRHKAMLRRHVGKQVQFHATHHANDDESEVQAVRVRGLDHLSNKPHKHITISTGKGVVASKSNDILKGRHGDRIPDWVRLNGTVEIVDRLGAK